MPATSWDAHMRFLDHPVVQAYVSQRAFGQLTAPLQAITAEIRSRTSAGGRILVPCFGDSARLLAVASQLADRTFDVVHASPERARDLRDLVARIRLPNLTVRTGDPGRLAIEAGSLDVVLGLHALHHIEPLEEFWRGCLAALRPDGVVLAQEYVGPSRLQWPEAQRADALAALGALVPEALGGGEAATLRCSTEALPTAAAARSSELLTTCAAAGFAITGRAEPGCGLLIPVLIGRAHLFQPDNWQHNRVLATLFREEQRLLATGALGVDYAMFVAEPQ